MARSRAASPVTSAPVSSVNARRGPQAGQALGWAWKRRDVGSSYSVPAFRAHPEGPHRGLRPVVGQHFQNRVAWAALRAVDEGIAIRRSHGSSNSRRQSAQSARSAARRSSRQAGRLDWRGWRNPPGSGFAGPVERLGLDRKNFGGGRRPVARARLGQRRDGPGRWRADKNAAPDRCGPSHSGVRGGDAVHERPEADALHGAAHAEQDIGVRDWRFEAEHRGRSGRLTAGRRARRETRTIRAGLRQCGRRAG